MPSGRLPLWGAWVMDRRHALGALEVRPLTTTDIPLGRIPAGNAARPPREVAACVVANTPHGIANLPGSRNMKERSR